VLAGPDRPPVTPSRYVRFSGGPPIPAVAGEMPSPGEEIVQHLVASLPKYGIAVLEQEDVEYARELKCSVRDRVYVVSVAYDWLNQGWWEVFWEPRLGVLQRLLGRSEADELRLLAQAIAQALDSCSSIQERRWYPQHFVDTRKDVPFSATPTL